jgi:hypothetical protein
VSPRTLRWAFALAVLVHLAVLYWPDPAAGPPTFPGVDKAVHALVFGAVAWTGRAAGLPVRLLAAALLGHAVLSEVLQHAVLPERSGDPWDAVADVVGTLGGLLVPLPRSPGRAMMAGRR